jgi:hypothetical protein
MSTNVPRRTAVTPKAAAELSAGGGADSLDLPFPPAVGSVEDDDGGATLPDEGGDGGALSAPVTPHTSAEKALLSPLALYAWTATQYRVSGCSPSIR